ncbi:hypothetical protein BSLA_03f1371 [Burkholderia stabilis]|nr:hypothetical protein BSLA_03f1371 [Burkholderia stabilis]
MHSGSTLKSTPSAPRVKRNADGNQWKLREFCPTIAEHESTAPRANRIRVDFSRTFAAEVFSGCN